MECVPRDRFDVRLLLGFLLQEAAQSSSLGVSYLNFRLGLNLICFGLRLRHPDNRYGSKMPPTAFEIFSIKVFAGLLRSPMFMFISCLNPQELQDVSPRCTTRTSYRRTIDGRRSLLARHWRNAAPTN